MEQITERLAQAIRNVERAETVARLQRLVLCDVLREAGFAPPDRPPAAAGDAGPRHAPR